MSTGNPDIKVYVYALFSSLILIAPVPLTILIAGARSCGSLSLVTRPKYPPPPSRDKCRNTLSHCVSCGIGDYRCYTPPHSFLQHGLSQSKDRPNKGGIAEKLASEAYRAIGGVARNSIANRAIKAFSPKRALVFAVNGASAPPAHPRPLAPFSSGGGGGFTENPRGGGSSRKGGGGPGVCTGNLGGEGAPRPHLPWKWAPFSGRQAPKKNSNL